MKVRTASEIATFKILKLLARKVYKIIKHYEVSCGTSEAESAFPKELFQICVVFKVQSMLGVFFFKVSITSTEAAQDLRLLLPVQFSAFEAAKQQRL